MKTLKNATLGLTLALTGCVANAEDNINKQDISSIEQSNQINDNESAESEILKYISDDGTVNEELFASNYGFNLNDKEALKEALNITEEEYQLLNNEVVLKAGFLPDLKYIIDFPYNLIWLILFCLLLGSKMTRPFTIATLTGLKEVLGKTWEVICPISNFCKRLYYRLVY